MFINQHKCIHIHHVYTLCISCFLSWSFSEVTVLCLYFYTHVVSLSVKISLLIYIYCTLLNPRCSHINKLYTAETMKPNLGWSCKYCVSPIPVFAYFSLFFFLLHSYISVYCKCSLA